jgi:sodium-coupled neutral amino acid transporter 11
VLGVVVNLFTTTTSHLQHTKMAKDSSSIQPPKSPFFAPSTPRKLVKISTPGGTSRLIKKESPKTKEHKSTVAGATSNLVNAIIGAGIVGIPYAIKECGLVAGIILVLLCAVLTEKSLRVLVDTAKHVDVPSYETLFESTYGSAGFYFISVNMLIMAYGGCLSYLTIIKDTLPVLLGVERYVFDYNI